MLDNVRKFGVIAAIALLFTLFTLSIIDVVMPEPRYEQYCPSAYEMNVPVMPVPYGKEPAAQNCSDLVGPTAAEQDNCSEMKGYLEYRYASDGCPESFFCNTCNAQQEKAYKQYRLVGFIISSIMGLAGILVGLYLRHDKDVVEWIYSGVLIGGILTIFIGTLSYFHDMGRFIKPFVLLGEFFIIIWVAMKTMNHVPPSKKR